MRAQPVKSQQIQRKMLNKDSSQVTESSTQLNHCANVPSEPPTFTTFATEQDHLLQFLPPMTPIDNIFKDIVTPLMEEANAPSQYNFYSEATTYCPNLYGMGCDDLFIPLFESFYVLPPLSPLNSFEDTTAIPSPPEPLADGQHGSGDSLSSLYSLPTVDQFDNSDAKVTPSILPPVTKTVSATVILPGSPPATVDDTSTRAIATTPSSDPTIGEPSTSTTSTMVALSSSPPTSDATIANAISSVESSIKRKQRRPRKMRCVNSSGDGVQPSHVASLAMEPLQEIEHSNAFGPTFTQEEATTSQMDVQNIFSGLGSKENILKPSIIRVDRKEDVTEKITSFAKEKGPVSVIGAVGTLSIVQLLQQGKTTTFEGNFDIISLFGTLLFTKDGEQHRMGQLSVTIVGADGKVFGGPVHGHLVAASPIQMIGLTFSPTGYKLRRLKTKLKLPQHQLQTTSMNHDCEAQVEEEKHQSEEANWIDDAIQKELNENITKDDGTTFDEVLAEYMNVKLQLPPQSLGDVPMNDVIHD